MHNPPKILIVDDESFNVDYLEQELDDLGYQTISATNGQDALAQVAAENPDVILLDIMMPIMDGFTVLSQLKADEATRHIPVIVISAMRDLKSVVEGIQRGAEDYMPKPFDPVLLRARLDASLEKKRLHDLEERYRRGLERDLEIGHEIQLTFLPSQLPQLPGWELAAHFIPARQVAGDLYDAFILEKSKRLGIVVGDVSDKGVGAALYMALYRSLIRVLSLQADAPLFSDEPAQLAQIVMLTNEYATRTHGEAAMFTSLFMGLLNPLTGILTYVNAGHNPPLILARTGELTELTRTGTILGVNPEWTIEARQTRLEPGEMFVGYTDGVTEAQNETGEFFGEDRLYRLLRDPTLSAVATLDRVESAVREFIGGAPQSDDITLLAIRRATLAEG